jgi:hypothetical protein
MAHDNHVYDPSFVLMGLMQDVNGNPTNPIPTIERLQHVVDIGRRHPPRATTIACINPIFSGANHYIIATKKLHIKSIWYWN